MVQLTYKVKLAWRVAHESLASRARVSFKFSHKWPATRQGTVIMQSLLYGYLQLINIIHCSISRYLLLVRRNDNLHLNVNS